MEIVRRVHSMKEVCRQARANGRKVGFVATMGALHDGHLGLIRRVKEVADIVVVSVFVNPAQFGPEEDFERYPRDLARDIDLCITEEVDYVFAPSAEEMYPEGSQTFVEVSEISAALEGQSRPDHFRGVATVVMKLLQIVQPGVAAFGQKDAQQAVVLQRMARDLMLDVEILVLPTVRDEDGLALSSRNRFLSEGDRRAALAVPRSLDAARQAVTDGQRQAAKIVDAARAVLAEETALEADYIELVDADTFQPVDQLTGETFLVVAATVGGVRLLDNAILRS